MKCGFQKFGPVCKRELYLDWESDLYCFIHGTRYFPNLDTIDFKEEPAPIIESGKPWSDEELKELLHLRAVGYRVKTCARILGRSHNSVYNKLWLLARKEHERTVDNRAIPIWG